MFQSRPNRGVRPGPVESALFLTALGGAALCYVLAGVVALVARSQAAEVAKDPSGRDDLVARTGQMTFPQILVGDRAIGGFRELLEADRAGVLKRLIAAA